MPVSSGQVDLVKAVSSGNCILFAGSGPSTELGMPTWAGLAKSVVSAVGAAKPSYDKAGYRKFLEEGGLPQVFDLAEEDLGSRERLIEVLRENIPSKASALPGSTYEILTAWPFAGFITTNWDDLLSVHLNYHRKPHTVLSNAALDAQRVSADSPFVWKLHGDLSAPETVIATASDYKRFSVDGTFHVCRRKLEALFQLHDVVIVGHSLTDFNIQFLLQLTSLVRDPRRPLFMMAPDPTPADVRHHLKHHATSIIPYANPDGKHQQLKRRIRVLDRFIQAGRPATKRALAAPVENADAATALYLVRMLRAAEREGELERKDCVAPLVLQRLSKEESLVLEVPELFSKEPLKSLAGTAINTAVVIEETLDELESSHMIARSGNTVTLTKTGVAKVDLLGAERIAIRDHALGDFESAVRDRCKCEVNDADMEEQKSAIERLLTEVFRRRGIGIVNQAIAEREANKEDLVRYFEAIEEIGRDIKPEELKDSFVEAAHDFLISPTDNQRRFTAALAQGFFLYYMAGADSRVTETVKSALTTCGWVVDSSVLIPLLARGSSSCAAISDLFDAIRKLGLKLYTTPKLLQEVKEHLDFAIWFSGKFKFTELDYLEGALAQGTWRQNQFVDGFIRMSADGEIAKFKDYLRRVWGSCKSAKVADLVADYGVQLIRPGTVQTAKDTKKQSYEEMSTRIRDERTSRSSLKHDFQVTAEAEVGILIDMVGSRLETGGLPDSCERLYFLSSSRVLDRSMDRRGVAWTPFAMSQILVSLGGGQTDPMLLGDLLLTEFYVSGVAFIDKAKYSSFFSPTIDQSKLVYEEQKDLYLEALEEDADVLDEYFNRLDDLKKPLFVEQLGWKVAQRKEKALAELRERNRELQTKGRRLERNALKEVDEKKARTIEALQNRIRNLEDPKRLRKVLRKAANKDKKRRQK